MIRASTKVYGLIADPIGHSLSPLLQNTLSGKMGADAVYVPLPVHDNLKNAVAGAYALGIEGINITTPYKTEIVQYLTGLDEAAGAVGAVNTLVRSLAGYRGYNTDLPGLRKALKSAGIVIAGKDVILIGAGGAAKAVAYLSALSGAKSLTILNRSIEKAELISEGLHAAFPDFPVRTEEIRGWKKLRKKGYISFQTTSVGMFPHIQDCIIEEEAFYRKCSAGIDLVYTPTETVFLKKMKSAGNVTLGGLHMLIYQGALSWELWNLGIKVPEKTINEVYETVRKELLKREKQT